MRGVSLLAICVLIFSSCTIVSKYHSTGFNISWNKNQYSNSKTQSLLNKEKANRVSNITPNQQLELSQTKFASQNPKTTSTNKTFTHNALRQSVNRPIVDFVVAPIQNSSFATKPQKASNTHIFGAGSFPLDSAKVPRPKKTLEELEKQLFFTEERIRDNFEGFALLLSPLLINASGKESKFIKGWNITFFTLSLLCLFFAIFYCIKYVFQWSRYTILRHTRK